MGVDYVIDLECAPKEQHGVDGLLQMLKARGGIDMLVEQARRSGDERPLEDIKITRVLRTPQGDTETDVSLAEMLAGAAPLDGLRPTCLGCPANRGEKGFGCFGYINYPISEAAERWLLSRLPDELESPAMYLLKSAIADFEYDGAPARKMRDAGDMFFVARKAPTRTWGKKKLFRGYELEISSDQVFHMMFHVGHAQPMHAALVCMFLGVIPFEALQDPDAMQRAKLTIPDESRAAQLAQFLLALAWSASREISVSISA